MAVIRNDFFECLFDRKTFNQRRMILLLYATNGRWVSSDWLGEEMGLSKRSTLSTINDLVQQIEQFQPDNYRFHLSKSRGVSLDVKSDADIYQLITFIITQCSTITMLESLLLEDFESVKSYGMRHFISESTVRRDLKKIQELMAHYHIGLERESAKLVGEEHQIRMFMAIFYWIVYRGSTWPFKYVDESLMENFVDQLLDNDMTVYPYIPYEHKKQMAYLFAEAIIRTRKGNFVQMAPDFSAQLTNNQLFLSFDKQLRSLSGIVQEKDSEIPFFFAAWLVLTKTIDILKEPVLEQFLAELAEEKSEIFSATELMVARFQEKFFSVKEDELLRFKGYVLGIHYFAYYFKGFNTDVTGNTYRNIFFERYPQLIQKIKGFINELYKESSNDIFLETDYLLLTYLRNIFFLEEPCNYETKITILIESDMPRLLMQKFIRQINGYFGYLYNITICDVFDIRDQPVDILLTTSTIEGLCQLYPDAEIVVVSKTLSIVDMARIDQVLEHAAARKSK